LIEEACYLKLGLENNQMENFLPAIRSGRFDFIQVVLSDIMLNPPRLFEEIKMVLQDGFRRTI